MVTIVTGLYHLKWGPNDDLLQEMTISVNLCFIERTGMKSVISSYIKHIGMRDFFKLPNKQVLVSLNDSLNSDFSFLSKFDL